MSRQNTCNTERIEVILTDQEAREEAGFLMPEIPRRKWRRTGKLPDGSFTWASEEREPHEDHSFEEGFSAGRASRGINSNPYADGRYSLSREWEMGYETGMEERMEEQRIRRMELKFE